ncbi:hypothetical protein [Histidinibacterium aquaticum]|uniref:Uncharacterized protein n=1 Tax=Histidinibacterium aquaticum TaxID=2613962 RepID=A0A5J5GJ53_9RHOB|nr:hypothetical protein [Histidinibacterium aquaticum]KAA9008147.1 hypothetical protein F3S47_11650 [Histidinibacterium aquaticum]
MSSLALTIEESEGVFSLTGLQLNQAEARAKLTFGGAKPLDEVLRPRAVPQVRRMLDAVDRDTGVWSFPNDRVVMSNLVLSEPRLVVSRVTVEPDARLFVLRFRRLFGLMTELLDPSVTIANPLRSQLEDLAFSTIEQALLPLFNIGEYIGVQTAGGAPDGIPQESLMEVLNDLRERIDALHLNYLVLSQHLSGRSEPGVHRLPGDLLSIAEGGR